MRLVERSPVIAALLRDGLRRAAADRDIGPWVTERCDLTVADGRDYLRGLTADQRPDVVYLDPMYPQRRKAALAGKDMRLLRQLVGDDDDAQPQSQNRGVDEIPISVGAVARNVAGEEGVKAVVGDDLKPAKHHHRKIILAYIIRAPTILPACDSFC